MAANWREVKEAGVTFWFNDTTGVATDECPQGYAPSLPKQESHDGKTDADITLHLSEEGRSGDVEQGEGTGALVYDSSEYDEVMRLLDSVCTSRAATGANT